MSETARGGARGDSAFAATQVDWRDRLTHRFIPPFLIVFTLATFVAAKTLHNTWERTALVGLSAACVLVVAISGLTKRPSGRARAWLLVIPGALSALIGFLVVGFLSGPAVVLTLTLVICGALLGKRAMLWLSLVTGCGLVAVAWAMIHAWVELPNPTDVSVTNPVAWTRTLCIVYLGIGLFGTLIVALIDSMEGSLRQTEAEVQRRERAERERAQAERAVLEANQLEIIGRLAAGVAHDFNNNLTAILGCAELLKLDLAPNSTGWGLAHDIQDASLRAADLTRQLLAYSRKAQVLLVPRDLHQMIEAAVALVQRTVDRSIEIDVRLGAQEAHVAADGTLLQSAFMNLLLNARDAMPDGGRVLLETSVYHVSQVEAVKAGETVLPAGAYVLVEVTDTGAGIPADLLPKIFDPFFTTKALGRGTGLGLSAVLGTVLTHGGAVSVRSTVGTGTVFRILLPQHVGVVRGSAAEQVSIQNGVGRILLVDDEAAVRNTAAASLRSLGYSVTLAEDGEDALQLLQGAPRDHDMVLLDLRMPRRGGESTFNAIRELNPALPVLIWSGHGAENDVERMLRNGAAGFLQKPYRIAELSQAVASILAQVTGV